MRRRAKLDANQREIVIALQQLGCSVQSLATIGSGCPDLMVGKAGRTVLLEVKHGRGVLTALQGEWRARWRGGVPFVVRTVDEAIAAVVGS